MSDNQFPITIPQCELSRIGAQFPETLDWDDYKTIGRNLVNIHGCSQFWLGDWALYGASQEYGERYKLLMAETDAAYGTLANQKWVASRIEFSRRREKLTFAHHYEVAKLSQKEQDKYLARAESKGWSHLDLRKAIRADLASYTEPQTSGMGFALMRWATEGLRHLNRWATEQEPERWPTERKESVKRDLQPLVDFYNRLT